MKKSTVRITVVFVILIIVVVGYYTYLSGKSKDAAGDAKMTEIQIALSRDLGNNYPPTVKEVMKYYADIQKCLYGGAATDEEIEQLGLKARELYDEELLENNDETMNLLRLKAEVESFQADEKKMTAISVSASNNVETFSEDGYDFARIQCYYTIVEKGQSSHTATVYLLRQDENRRWKIYGWELAKNVNPQ